MPFVIYDQIEPAGYRSGWAKIRYDDPTKARAFKTLRHCVNQAELMNTRRRVPSHLPPEGDRKFQHLPLCEIHEFDVRWNRIGTHQAPPHWLALRTDTGEVTIIRSEETNADR